MFEIFLNQFVLAFREGIEASLLVATILIALKQSEAPHLIKSAWTGVWAAIVLCVVAGFYVHNFAQNAGPTIEFWLYLAAAITVSSMVFWMHRTGSQIRKGVTMKIHSLRDKEGIMPQLGMFAFVFFMVMREGIELMLLMLAFGSSSSSFGLVGAVLLGIGLAVYIGYVLVKGFVKINVGQFLQWTSYVLILFILQLVIGIFHEGYETGILGNPPSWMPTVDYLAHELPIFAYAGIVLFTGIAAYQITQAKIARRKAELEGARA